MVRPWISPTFVGVIMPKRPCLPLPVKCYSKIGMMR